MRASVDGAEGALRTVTGDLLAADAAWICHQCNCKSKKALGLAFDLFKMHPWANIYSKRKGNEEGVPGTIVPIKPPGPGYGVINALAQYHPRTPRTGDTARMRVQWFQACLKAIEEMLPAFDGPTSLAFPFMIGCGLAGGDWPAYQALLERFARENPHIAVSLYKQPAKEGNS